ncbi:hypothetical protein [Photobacterium nomapromontoriensis]|uniref:hypothetical protein n=1 Tax=Photobacterium nomapromontoriensis TaxID=2910237 RepID=UPI003D0EAF5B
MLVTMNNKDILRLNAIRDALMLHVSFQSVFAKFNDWSHGFVNLAQLAFEVIHLQIKSVPIFDTAA